MKEVTGNVENRIYAIAGAIFLLTAWFSSGYNHFDEHFQIIEFAGLKLGLTLEGNLPWEYGRMMRPAFQPLLVWIICKGLSVVEISDPFFIAICIRLFSAALTFGCIHLLIRLYAPEILSKKLYHWFLLLSFFLWFVPYNGVRFSSETISGRVLLIGLALFLLRKQIRPADYLMAGIVMGIAFILRYQVAFMILGFAAWLFFIRKCGISNIIIFVYGLILSFGIGVMADRWFYGQWVLTSWNYLYQNIFLDKASGFGVSPWWYYISETFLNAFPPLSIIYILAVFLYIWAFPKDVLTWTIVPFLAIHFIIPHKEIRFLFPMIGLLPVMIIKTADLLLQRKDGVFPERRSVKILTKGFWILNILMLIILIFRPADEHIALYRKLWRDYQAPAILYYMNDNPYHRAKVDVHFYKRENLTFRKVDSTQQIQTGGDTIALLVIGKPSIPAERRFDPLLVYASHPAWIKKFNINNWTERTSFWYIYEMNSANK